jgi:hypothetical protein
MSIYRILPAADVVSTTGAVEDIEEEEEEAEDNDEG